MPAISALEIASCNREPSLRLSEAQIIVHDARFNYGKGRDNPVDAVTFYRDQ